MLHSNGGKRKDAWIAYNPMSDDVKASMPKKFGGLSHYRVVVSVKDPATKRTKRFKRSTGVSIHGGPKAFEAALAARLQIIAEYQTKHDPTAPLRLRTFFETYLAEREGEGLSRSSLVGIQAAFNALSRLVGESVFITQVAPADLRKLLFVVTKSASVAQAHYRYLHAAFERAVQDGRLTVNPLNQVDKKALRKRHVARPRGILAMKDILAVYELMPKQTYTDRTFANYFLCLAFTATRRGEAAFLRVQDVNFMREEIEIAKMEEHSLKTEASEGTLPMLPQARKALQDQLRNKASHPSESVRESKFIFCNSKGEHYGPDTFSHAVVKRAKAALEQINGEHEGFDLHSLRHSLIQWAIDSGVPPVVVSKLARHARLSTTLAFYHKTRDTKTDFAELLALPEFNRSVANGVGYSPEPMHLPSEVVTYQVHTN